MSVPFRKLSFNKKTNANNKHPYHISENNYHYMGFNEYPVGGEEKQIFTTSGNRFGIDHISKYISNKNVSEDDKLFNIITDIIV